MAIEMVNWLEIPVTDMDRARKFYETVFEFKTVDMELGGEIYPCFPNRNDDGYSGALVQYEFTAPAAQPITSSTRCQLTTRSLSDLPPLSL